MRAVILAGGAGSRMGGNKPFTPYGKTTLIEAAIARLKPQVREVVVNAGARGSPLSLPLSALGVRLIHDDIPGKGPLSGVLSALRFAESADDNAVITAPCDMPELPMDMVERLSSANADIVWFKGERDYPLCARWRVSIAPALEAALTAAAGDGLRVMHFLATQDTVTVPAEDDRAFLNINRL